MARKISGAKTSSSVGRAFQPAGSPDLPVRGAERATGKSPAPADRNVCPTAKPSALVDTRVIYCGDNLDQLKKLPDACVDLIYIDPPFNSNRNYDGGQSGSDCLHNHNIRRIMIYKKRLPYG